MGTTATPWSRPPLLAQNSDAHRLYMRATPTPRTGSSMVGTHSPKLGKSTISSIPSVSALASTPSTVIGIDARRRREPVLGWAPRTRAFVLRIRPSLDEHAELGVAAQRHLLGIAAEELGEELGWLHRMGIRVDDAHVGCHGVSFPPTAPEPARSRADAVS